MMGIQHNKDTAAMLDVISPLVYGVESCERTPAGRFLYYLCRHDSGQPLFIINNIPFVLRDTILGSWAGSGQRHIHSLRYLQDILV